MLRLASFWHAFTYLFIGFVIWFCYRWLTSSCPLTLDLATEIFGEIFHGFLPVAILGMEMYVLASMGKESKEREHTVSSFEALALRGRRNEYLIALSKAIGDIEREAFFTSASMEASSNSDGQRLILEAAIARKNRGAYRHRGLIAKRFEALPGALEIACKTDIELKFCDAVTLSRLRFFVRDNEHCVLGMADGQQSLADQKKTTDSVTTSSSMLADSLLLKFESLWDGSLGLGEYIDFVILRASPRPTIDTIYQWFSAAGVEREKLEEKLSQLSKEYRGIASPEASSR
jgi:hypothetical protein